ncbi:hypothetical protein JOF48_001593 [Arthrobacter stackebrandtii]|uniref:Uncharacterized protein n=2 Tax=Arthrobacter stackebrandtii TaxID=272161 RepID=A0ABS4YVG9_9MICC|nr:hypothetical protein [Arthrobacter stackebrandtii]PYG99854.1 hypothetical protein CVV67_12815 [Arthrobacter stackebrandtii]
MSIIPSPQAMKSATAAKKLGILLSAAPAEFQENAVSREDFKVLQDTPPEWLAELRRNGPHPRPVIAQKLNISIGGLNRSDITEALTTAEITALLQAPPAWLVEERAVFAQARAEAKLAKEREAARRPKS